MTTHIRLQDAEHNTVNRCQSFIVPVGYDALTNHWKSDYCKRHAQQERALQHFFKVTERAFNGLGYLRGVDGAAGNKRIGLLLVSAVIVAREAHSVWFFRGSNTFS
ncbi:hypothetical protein PG993_003908 [Apiospora rasikravindrae]|uniref:Transposase n=1 Tax=Apiospora rasikravindrae TaxID=990691 RepID=A0ABR1U139_9PEZI